MALYVMDESNAFGTFIRVSSIEPTDANYDEVDNNSFIVRVPKNTISEATKNIISNVLRAGGADVVQC